MIRRRVNIVQEHVNDRTVALSVKAAKLTSQLLAKAMRAFLKNAKKPAVKHGKQSVKSLTKQGSSLANIEISGDDIGTFKKTARKYNVDFSLKRDDSHTPPNWVVFFKAKDSKSLESAFSEYSKQILNTKNRKPSLLEKLEKYRELAKSVVPPTKNRDHGGHQL